MSSLFIRAACTVGLALAVATPAAAQSSARAWYGEYQHTETIPRLSGVTAAITYTLRLSDSGCRLEAQGLQTSKDIRCTARRNGNSLQISFHSYAEPPHGVARYRSGEPLLRLTRTPRGLMTHWQGFTMSDARRKSGRYLERQR